MFPKTDTVALALWASIYYCGKKMYLVHVSQLAIDFTFKDIFSTNKNMKTNICFIIIISFLSSSNFEV